MSVITGLSYASFLEEDKNYLLIRYLQEQNHQQVCQNIDLLDLRDVYEGKFYYHQRLPIFPLLNHPSLVANGGRIKREYGDVVFQSETIDVFTSVAGFESFYLARTQVDEDAEKAAQLADIHEANQRSAHNQPDITNPSNVYLRQELNENGKYLSHLHAVRDIGPRKYICLIGGNINHVPRDELLERCSDVNNDYLSFPVPLADIARHYVKKRFERGDPITGFNNEGMPMIVEAFEVTPVRQGKGKNKGGMLVKMCPATFLKYARRPEDANVEIHFERSTKEKDAAKIKKYFYLTTTEKGVRAHEELLLNPIWLEERWTRPLEVKRRKPKGWKKLLAESNESVPERTTSNPMVPLSTSAAAAAPPTKTSSSKVDKKKASKELSQSEPKDPSRRRSVIASRTRSQQKKKKASELEPEPIITEQVSKRSRVEKDGSSTSATADSEPTTVNLDTIRMQRENKSPAFNESASAPGSAGMPSPPPQTSTPASSPRGPFGDRSTSPSSKGQSPNSNLPSHSSPTTSSGQSKSPTLTSTETRTASPIIGWSGQRVSGPAQNQHESSGLRPLTEVTNALQISPIRHANETTTTNTTEESMRIPYSGASAKISTPPPPRPKQPRKNSPVRRNKAPSFYIRLSNLENVFPSPPTSPKPYELKPKKVGHRTADTSISLTEDDSLSDRSLTIVEKMTEEERKSYIKSKMMAKKRIEEMNSIIPEDMLPKVGGQEDQRNRHHSGSFQDYEGGSNELHNIGYIPMRGPGRDLTRHRNSRLQSPIHVTEHRSVFDSIPCFVESSREMQEEYRRNTQALYLANETKRAVLYPLAMSSEYFGLLPSRDVDNFDFVGIVFYDKLMNIEEGGDIKTLTGYNEMPKSKKVQLRKNIIRESYNRGRCSPDKMDKEIAFFEKFLELMHACGKTYRLVNATKENLEQVLAEIRLRTNNRRYAGYTKGVHLFVVAFCSVYVDYKILLHGGNHLVDLISLFHIFFGPSQGRPQVVFPTLYWSGNPGTDEPRRTNEIPVNIFQLHPCVVGCKATAKQSLDGLKKFVQAAIKDQTESSVSSESLLLSSVACRHLFECKAYTPSSKAVNDQCPKPSFSICGDAASMVLHVNPSATGFGVRDAKDAAAATTTTAAGFHALALYDQEFLQHTDDLVAETQSLFNTCNVQQVQPENCYVESKDDFLHLMQAVSNLAAKYDYDTVFVAISTPDGDDKTFLLGNVEHKFAFDYRNLISIIKSNAPVIKNVVLISNHGQGIEFPRCVRQFNYGSQRSLATASAKMVIFQLSQPGTFVGEFDGGYAKNRHACPFLVLANEMLKQKTQRKLQRRGMTSDTACHVYSMMCNIVRKRFRNQTHRVIDMNFKSKSAFGEYISWPTLSCSMDFLVNERERNKVCTRPTSKGKGAEHLDDDDNHGNKDASKRGNRVTSNKWSESVFREKINNLRTIANTIQFVNGPGENYENFKVIVPVEVIRAVNEIIGMGDPKTIVLPSRNQVSALFLYELALNLSDTSWATDSEIEHYTGLIVERNSSKPRSRPMTFFKAHFFTGLLDAFKKNSRHFWLAIEEQMAVLSQPRSLAVFLINSGSDHWIFAIYDRDDNVLTHYQSMPSMGEDKRAIQQAKDILEFGYKNLKEISPGIAIPNIKELKIKSGEMLYFQKGKNDCGIFLVQNLEQVCRGLPPHTRMENVRAYRHLMKVEFLLQSLIPRNYE